MRVRKNKLVRKAYRRLRRVLNWGVPAAGEVWEPYRVGGDEWESQYRSGYWGYMRQLHELARYSVIVGYLQYLKYGGGSFFGCQVGTFSIVKVQAKPRKWVIFRLSNGYFLD
jgi:hypothetical protein